MFYVKWIIIACATAVACRFIFNWPELWQYDKVLSVTGIIVLYQHFNERFKNEN